MIGWSVEWVMVIVGGLGCVVVVGGSEAVGGTLGWRQLVLLGGA